MSLKSDKSRKSVFANIRTLLAEGKPREQAVALKKAGKARKAK